MIRGSSTMEPTQTTIITESSAMQSIKDAMKNKDRPKLIDVLSEIKKSAQKGDFKFKDAQ